MSLPYKIKITHEKQKNKTSQAFNLRNKKRKIVLRRVLFKTLYIQVIVVCIND